MTKTPLTRHLEKWSRGCGSELCKSAKNICLGRGKVPCDICFVAEAPGASEDVLGGVLIGPAGQLFDRIISRIIPTNLKCGYTNLVGCMPKDEEGRKTGEPDDESVIKCQGRLREFIWLCDPQLIVCVGKLSAGWLATDYLHHPHLHKVCSICHHKQVHTKRGLECVNKHLGAAGVNIPTVEVDHPAFILRNEYANQSLLIQRCQSVIREAIEEMNEVRHNWAGEDNWE